MYIATKHIQYDSVWGGYMSISLSMDITVEINDARTSITFRSSNVSGSRTDSALAGYGFINYVGLCWDLPWGERRFDDPEAGPETYANSWPEIPLVAASLGIPEHVLESRTVWGTYASDNTSLGSQFVSGYKGAASSVYTRALTSSDFDADGNLRNIRVINAYRRWRDNEATQAVVTVGNDIFTLDLAELDWSYYPWSLRKSNTWRSANRAGGSLKIRKSNAWRDAKNTIYSSPPSSGFTRKSNSWRTTPKTGTE